jgi:MSHA pilin protein MshD
MPVHRSPFAQLPRSAHAPRHGLSLIELLIFIGIVSVALAALVRVFVQATVASADPLVQRQALAIAESLLEEVQLMPFTFCDSEDANVETATSAAGCAGAAEAPGPEAGETRTGLPSFDHVNDYHGLALAGGITDLTGTAVAGLGAYSASVSVAAAALHTLSAASDDALKISVTVTGPGGVSLTLVGYRSRHAPNATL